MRVLVIEDERKLAQVLAIAKWAVEANGGRLTLASGGSGSVFSIIVPLRTSP